VRGKGVSRVAAHLHDNISDLTESYRHIFGQRYEIHNLTNETSLVTLVKKYNANGNNVKIGATMPADRIFGLAGLSRDVHPVQQSDYKNVASVYTDFAEAEVKNDVDILLFAQRDKCRRPTANNLSLDLSTLPSWVPDWSIDRLRTPYAYPDLTHSPTSSAGGRMRGKPTRIDRTLRIEGLVLDSIVRVGQRQVHSTWHRRTTEGLDYASLKHFFDEVEEFLVAAAALRGEERREGEEADNNTPSRAKLSLVDGGLTPMDYESPSTSAMYIKLKELYDLSARAEEGRDTYTSLARAWARHRPTQSRWTSVLSPPGLLKCTWISIDVAIAVARMRTWILFSALRYWWLRPLVRRAEGQSGSAGDIKEYSSKDLLEFQDNILRNRGRRLYVTHGGLVGLGPENMELGDDVAILFGGRVPFIVRKTTTTTSLVRVSHPSLDCTLVGEAYCQGMMEGEALVGKDLDKATTFFIS